MTEHNSTDAVDRWLTEHHEQFIEGLAARLDLDAGLEEVLFSSRHEELVDQVRGKLDLDAGLAAILPPVPEPLPAVEEEVEPGSLPWVSDTLARMPLQPRLKLRARHANELHLIARTLFSLAPKHPGPKELYQIKMMVKSMMGERDDACSTAEAIAYLYTRLPNDAGCDFDIPSDRYQISHLLDDVLLFPKSRWRAPTDPARGSGAFIASKWADDCWRLMEEIGARGRHTPSAGRSWWSGSQSRPQHWAESVANFICALLDGEGSTPAGDLLPTETAERLQLTAGHVLFVEQMLNDFTGVDLRNVELAGIPLDGVRWSDATTQWPEQWREQIERDSVHLGDGLFEIHYGTNTPTGSGSLL